MHTYTTYIHTYEYYFFSELRVSCCLRNNLQLNELQRSKILHYNCFVFQMTPYQKVRENLLYSRETCIHVNNGDTLCAIYVI